MNTDEKKLAIAAIIQKAHIDIEAVLAQPLPKSPDLNEGGFMVAGGNDEVEFITSPTRPSFKKAQEIHFLEEAASIIDGHIKANAPLKWAEIDTDCGYVSVRVPAEFLPPIDLNEIKRKMETKLELLKLE